MKFIKGYTHHDGSIGVLVRFGVGSDFTVRTPEFQKFADEALMSLAWHFKGGSFVTRKPNLSPDFSVVSWIGDGDLATLEEAIEDASLTFQEPIFLLEWQVLTAEGTAGEIPC